MSDTLNYVGALPGTKAFKMKSLTPEQKKMCIDKVDGNLIKIKTVDWV